MQESNTETNFIHIVLFHRAQEMRTKDFNDGARNHSENEGNAMNNISLKPTVLLWSRSGLKGRMNFLSPNVYIFYWIQINLFKLVTLSGVRAESLIVRKN